MERANQTLQDRLVKEMRLRGIDTIEAANAYATEFIADFNARFSKSPGQVFDKFGEFIVLDEKKTSCGRRLIERDDALRTGKIS